jgi:hypothetical protein
MAHQFPTLSSIESIGPGMNHLANNPKASVESLGRVFHQFVEDLSKSMPYADPIPLYLLPEGAQLIREEDPNAQGYKYCFTVENAADFDCHAWVKEYIRRQDRCAVQVSLWDALDWL